jgi:hypothetical protein
MACTSNCVKCYTDKENRGFRLKRYGGNFDNPSIVPFHVPEGVSVKPGDLLFTPAIGSQNIITVTTTGDYGVNGTDFLFGTALECANTETGDHFHFETQRIRDGHEYDVPMFDKTMTQAQLDSYVGTRTLAHYDAPTDTWTINNTLADAAGNSFIVVGGNAAEGFVTVEIEQ